MRSTTVPSISALLVIAVASVGCAANSEQASSGQVVAPSGSASSSAHASAADFHKDGYATFIEDGRLWVFREGSKELAEYRKNGELAKHVVLPAQGPRGMTVKSPDRDTVLEYMCAKPGYTVMAQEGRVWIFKDGSKDLEAFRSHGELAKHIVRPAKGPLRSTLRSPDAETLDAWMYSKPGFVTMVEDGRLWIFREGSKELAEFQKNGELAKHVVRPAAGPNRMTVKAPDTAIINDYLASAN